MPLYSQNPFIASVEVYNDEDFFDREEILAEIDRFVRRRFDYNALIFGQRRIGKTSLLRRIQKIYDEKGYFSVFRNMQGEYDKSTDEIVGDLARAIARKVDLSLPYVDEINQDLFKSRFLDDLQVALRGNLLLVILDEFDVLGDREDQAEDDDFAYHGYVSFLSEVIDVLYEKQIPVKFIFAIGRNYKDLDYERFGRIYKIGRQLELSFFDKRTVFELLDLSLTTIPFSDDAKERVWALAGGQPYFTQCLAGAAYEFAEENGYETIETAVVSEVFYPTVKKYSTGLLWIWDTLTGIDKIVLYIAAKIKEENNKITVKNILKTAEKDELLPFTHNLENTLKRLTDIDFLVTKNYEIFDFKAEFFRKWIISQITNSEIQKYFLEFDNQMKIWLVNAKYLIERKEYDKALKKLNKILDYNPQNQTALFFKAIIISKRKSIENFRRSFEILSKLYFSDFLSEDKKQVIENFILEYYEFAEEFNFVEDIEKINRFIQEL